MLTTANQISSRPSLAIQRVEPRPRHAGRRWLGPVAVALLAVGGVGSVGGCTLPSDCGDLDYPTYGGAWQRTRRDSGRVGSIFDPAGARMATLSDRDEAAEAEAARSPRESIHSTVPGRPAQPSPDRGQVGPDAEPESSPSDRSDRERLRSLELEEIEIQPGPPAPPDLH